MSKGSVKRPTQISEDEFQDNWDRVFGNKFTILVWPDNTVYFDSDPSLDYAHMSDDFIKAVVTERELELVSSLYDYCIEKGLTIK